MKTYKTEIIPQHTERVLNKRTCDICGRKAETYDWGAAMYEVKETVVCVEVRQRQGVSYPEGGSGTEIEVDLCPTCFKEKLVPWLRSQGATIEEKEWEW